MVAFQIDCPGCHEPCAVPPHLQGTEVRCPRCAVQFTAPNMPTEAENPVDVVPLEETADLPKTNYQPPAVVCPFCGTNAPPVRRKKVHPMGWLLFGVLLLPCLPFCWLALFIREEILSCSTCKRRLA